MKLIAFVVFALIVICVDTVILGVGWRIVIAPTFKLPILDFAQAWWLVLMLNVLKGKVTIEKGLDKLK